MKHSLNDTIAAIATPVGIGGVGVVRITGPKSLCLLKKAFKFSKLFKPIESHRVYHGWVVDPKNLNEVDESLAVCMLSPNSYTGEDIVEISCHGGSINIRRVLEIFVNSGARLAEPGEFTKRAFLNGKIDLLQAEAVVDLVSAKTEKGLEAAVGQLAGKMSAKIREIREALIKLMSEVEANIDFPDDVAELPPFSIEEAINMTLMKIEQVLATAEEGRILREGIRVAIVGRPNVGKSSLLNALLEEDRAIVTDVPGTTRDIIEEVINVDGLPIVIVDTAGIRQPKNRIEAFGVEKAKEELAHSELALIVIDASSRLTAEDNAIIEEAKQHRALLVLNKIDIGKVVSLNGGLKQLRSFKVSALKRTGLDLLKRGIVDCITGKRPFGEVDMGLINLRHKELLLRAKESLLKTIESCKMGASGEFITVDLKGAILALGEVSGEVVSEEVIKSIFERFCVGK